MNKKLQYFGFILVAIAISSFFGHLAIEVLEGRGGEIYKSYKGLNFTPIGVLIFAVVMPFFIGLAKIIGWYLGKDERNFKIYLKNKNKKI